MTSNQIAYREYLASVHWANLRDLVLARDGNRCVKCGCSQHLQVHHKFYRSRFEDSVPEDLKTLCPKCHREEHGIVKKKPAVVFSKSAMKRARKRKRGWTEKNNRRWRMVATGRWSA